jgi:hypothetical protein
VRVASDAQRKGSASSAKALFDQTVEAMRRQHARRGGKVFGHRSGGSIAESDDIKVGLTQINPADLRDVTNAQQFHSESVISLL